MCNFRFFVMKTSPTRELIFHVMASLAQFESSLISQRLKAGMARAKPQGKHIVRPPIANQMQEKIIELQREGVLMNKISKTLGIAYGTVYNYRSKTVKKTDNITKFLG